MKSSNEAYENNKGNPTINRLSPNEEQGRKRGGLRLLQATLIASGSYDANAENRESNKRTKEQQIASLIDYAKRENLFYRPTEFNRIGLYLANGAEQYVFFNGGQLYVTKFNSLKFHESPLEFFDRTALHNYLFPEAPYTLIGFSRTYPEEPCFSVVLTQPFVLADRGAEREEVILEMEKMGFEHKGGDTYVSPDYIVEDLHPGNALMTPLGQIAIIDPVIYLNTPTDDFKGARTIS